MSNETFSRYDTADYLKTEDDIAAYIDAVMEEGGDDPAYVARALGAVARARNLSQLARDVGMTRQGLDKALSAEGNPSFATVVKVAQALGLRLAFKPTHGGPAPAAGA
ncbi:putative addiction module antidote protein [Salmonella enterica]|nr:putative addiction module antidote protein [Salmonella enterica]